MPARKFQYRPVQFPHKTRSPHILFPCRISAQLHSWKYPQIPSDPFNLTYYVWFLSNDRLFLWNPERNRLASLPIRIHFTHWAEKPKLLQAFWKRVMETNIKPVHLLRVSETHHRAPRETHSNVLLGLSFVKPTLACMDIGDSDAFKYLPLWYCESSTTYEA